MLPAFAFKGMLQVSIQPVLVHGVLPFITLFPFVALPEVPLCVFLQPSEVPPSGSRTLVYQSLFPVLCHLLGIVCAIIQVIKEGTKQWLSSLADAQLC